MYDPKKYWEERGDHYKAEEDPNDFAILSDLAKNHGVQMILEVGSGYGRIYKGFREKASSLNIPYFMCDFAASMRLKCFESTNILPDSWDGVTLPYKDKTFDCVVSVNVMLHVPPDKIEAFIKEHKRVAARYLFVISGNQFSEPLAAHCFDHDYDRLLGENHIMYKIAMFKASKLWIVGI